MWDMLVLGVFLEILGVQGMDGMGEVLFGVCV